MKKLLVFALVFCMLAGAMSLLGVMAEDTDSPWAAAEPAWDMEEDFANVDAYPFQAVEELSSPKESFAVAGSDKAWAMGDKSRLYRKDNNTAVPYLTYQLPDGKDIAYFKVFFGTTRIDSKWLDGDGVNWNGSNNWPKIVAQISSDGKTFTDLPESEVYDTILNSVTPAAQVAAYKKQARIEDSGLRYGFHMDSAWGNEFNCTLTPVTLLPEGTKYIRFTFEKGKSNTQLQVAKIYLSSERDETMESKLALAAQIEKAQAYEKMGELGNYGSDKEALCTTLQSAIDTAQAVIAEPGSDKTAYDSAAETLGEALLTFMDGVLPTHGLTEPFHDTCEDLSKLWDGGIAVKNASGATPGITVGDQVRFVKAAQSHDRGPASIIYRFSEPFGYFRVVGMLAKNTSGVDGDFTVQIRGENTGWEDVTDLVFVTEDKNIHTWPSNPVTYRSLVYEGYNIPDYARYLRINFARTEISYDNTYYNAITDVLVAKEPVDMLTDGVYLKEAAIVSQSTGSAVVNTAGLRQADTFTVTADIRKNSFVDSGLAEADVVAVLYDYNTNTMIACDVEHISFDEGFAENKAEFQLTSPGLDIENGQGQVQFFILDSFTNIKPLTNVQYTF